jgi:hypothetical protein
MPKPRSRRICIRLQLDEERRRAEADKLAAITELENRSQEFMREKCEKMALEEKIASLQGQLLIGGNSAQVNPAIRCGSPPIWRSSKCHMLDFHPFALRSQLLCMEFLVTSTLSPKSPVSRHIGSREYGIGKPVCSVH